MSEKKREISFQELVRVLIEHRKWIVSEGKEGQRADLSNVRIDPRRINLRMIAIPEGILSNAEFTTFLEPIFQWPPHFEGATLYGANFEGAIFYGAHFEKANLYGAHFEWANLYGAHFEGADLREAHFEGAHLGEAHFEGAWLNEAHFEGAYLSGAYFDGTDLEEANFEGAILYGAHFEGADLRGADLRRTNLICANLENANVEDVKYDRDGTYRGIRVDSCFGSAQFKRHAQDQDWLEEFLDTRESKWQKVWAWFWGESCDYGRSFSRWGLVSFFIALFFAYAFTRWPDWVWRSIGGSHLDFACDWMPGWFWNTLADICPQFNQTLDFFSALYFSIVTFTTLGFGDIHATNLSAKFLVTTEVIIGYIMLGGLISILANKLARRS